MGRRADAQQEDAISDLITPKNRLILARYQGDEGGTQSCGNDVRKAVARGTSDSDHRLHAGEGVASACPQDIAEAPILPLGPRSLPDSPWTLFRTDSEM